MNNNRHSVENALIESLSARKSDEPGMYGRDGYFSRIDEMTVDLLCNIILTYSGIVMTGRPVSPINLLLFCSNTRLPTPEGSEEEEEEEEGGEQREEYM